MHIANDTKGTLKLRASSWESCNVRRLAAMLAVFIASTALAFAALPGAQAGRTIKQFYKIQSRMDAEIYIDWCGPDDSGTNVYKYRGKQADAHECHLFHIPQAVLNNEWGFIEMHGRSDRVFHVSAHHKDLSLIHI